MGVGLGLDGDELIDASGSCVYPDSSIATCISWPTAISIRCHQGLYERRCAVTSRDDPRHGHYRANELAVLVEEANAARRWVMAAPMGARSRRARDRRPRICDRKTRLEQMVACGMTPMQVLTAATTTAAELLGVVDDRGSIEVGKRADIVIATGDGSSVRALGERVTHVFQTAYACAEPV